MSLRFAAATALLAIVLQAQTPSFTDAFPPEEFAARRTELMRRIGDGVAILQGATERPAESPFRQNNQFFYLSGVELPRSILLVDGGAKRTALYLTDNERRARMWGPLLMPGSDAARATGIETVTKREDFDAALAALAAASRVIYTPMRPEVLEDAILMTDTGYENLSAFVPIEIDEIERLMAESGRK